jgi:hypothetical protein
MRQSGAAVGCEMIWKLFETVDSGALVRKSGAALLVPALVIGTIFAPTPSRAAPQIDVLIDFDDLINTGNDNGTAPNTIAYRNTYGSPGPHHFFFQPVNFQNSANCYDEECMIEFDPSGAITTMTKPGNPWTASPSDLTKTAFDLNSFFFDLQGNVDDTNSLTVTGFDMNGAAIQGANVTLTLGQTIGNLKLAFPSLIDVNLAHDANNQNPVTYPGTNLADTAAITRAGYFVFLGSAFDSVYSVNFSAIGPGQTRIDDIRVSYIPLPATIWLMLAGLFGLRFFSRQPEAAQA